MKQVLHYFISVIKRRIKRLDKKGIFISFIDSYKFSFFTSTEFLEIVILFSFISN